MENYNKAWKMLMVIGCAIIVSVFCIISFLEEMSSCMGVQILSEDEMHKYTEYVYQDFSKSLRHKEELVSVDVASSTVYISQDIDEKTTYHDLQGVITIDNPEYELFWDTDEAFDDLQTAVRDGHTFSLYITDGSSKYMEYNVVFTTLPLVRLEGEVTHVNDQGRDVLTGDICIWTPLDPESDEYTVKSTSLEWHLRGGTTANVEKKSWKLSLKKENGENENLSICGLGSDDDWVLNSMVMDDTRMREKLFMDLWNEVVVENNYSYHMSSGEYVELVSNGEYLGLYMVQRRIDAKFLGLGEDTALVRGMRLTSAPLSVNDAFEIREGDLEAGEVYSVMYHAVYTGQWVSLVDLENFVDMNLFIGMAVAPDNAGFNNMYWIIEKTGDGELPYKISLVPWDTDMSLGIVAEGGFRYNYDAAIHRDVGRMETGYMMIRLGYAEKVYSRWKELREGVFATENIVSYLDEYDEVLMSSGAYNRNAMLWGFRNGRDNYEESYEDLKTFIVDRLEWMDTLYMN